MLSKATKTGAASLMIRRAASSSSSASWRCDPSLVSIKPEIDREKFKGLAHHTLYADMSKDDTKVVFAAHLYDPENKFVGEYHDTLEYHEDTTCLEMRSSLASADHFASQKIFGLENLLVVTDSEEAFNHFNGTTTVNSKKSHHGRYKNRRKNRAKVEAKVKNLGFAHVTKKEDPAMARVDNAAKEFRESIK